MSANIRLADAIGLVVRGRLSAGVGYLRLPEIVSPLPVADLLDELKDLTDIRFAIFLHDPPVEQREKITFHVYEAISWRNDPAITDSLLIIGDLERDRAAGLASIPRITAGEVRQALLNGLIAEAQSLSASAKTVKLFTALKSDRVSLDIQYLADYCDALKTTLGSTDLDEAVRSLWRLGLIPDRASADVDSRRLRDNAQRVAELRESDATSTQRLIRQLSKRETGDYEAVRLFATTGQREYLRGLQFDDVREALTSARTATDGSNGFVTRDRATERQFLEAVRSGSIEEKDFLNQFAELAEEDASQTIDAGGADLDWDRVSTGQLAPLLQEAGGNVPYAASAGSIEVMPLDEPDPLPGKGEVSWNDLQEAIDDLRVLEEGVRMEELPSVNLERVLDLRTVLEPFVADLPREGVRLFLSAPNLAAQARHLVDAWVTFWHSMESLRTILTDVGELLAVGRRIALTDTRVIVQGTAVTAYLLPLHPMVLEPRVRAASMFREHAELDQDFFHIVLGAIDPAVPSIKLPVEDTTYDLAYTGQFRALPQYERRAQQFHSPDISRALEEVIDRFINAHPYARRSVRVALVDPTAETAKQLLKWLANVEMARRERIALDVYVQRESHDEVIAKLAEAQEELVSAEVSGSRFTYSVERLSRLDGLHALLEHSDRSPHILCLFDPAEVTQNSTPIANLSPVLGALVNEWEFGTRARREATPYIRPRTGSSSLSDYLSAQARLLGTDSVGTTERTPLLPPAVLRTLESVGSDTSWVVVSQGASALVAPPSIGSLELLGRTNSGSHTAFIYSETPALVLEPVLAYLQQHAYLQADLDDLIRFVLNTIRLALPEGLLGFYKRQGVLSDESVLGRLGLAAVVAHLQESRENPDDLIVSLDTEGARRWLGLREGAARRADLLRFAFVGDKCQIEAIEIKARSGSMAWGTTPPEAVVEALGQVKAMRELLELIFLAETDDQLTASRREILKRQVFLEALHQWEPVRQGQPSRYRELVRALNRLFARDLERKPSVEIGERVFIATPGDESGQTGGISRRRVNDVEIVQLGLGWFRSLLARQPGGTVELDPELLDMLTVDVALGEGSPTRVESEGSDGASNGEMAAVTSVSADADSEPGGDPPRNLEVIGVARPTPRDNLDELLSRLQGSFRARGIPYISINLEEAVIGPSVVQLPVRLEVGARSSQVENQAEDIARDLGVQAFRITNYAGRPGFALAEIPRALRQIPDVTTLSRPDLPYPALTVGAQLDFSPYWDCLDHIPHLLIAGKTGSGKSVLIRGLLWQLTRLYSPEEVDVVLIGPKAADYLDFTGAPHFKSPGDVHLRTEGAIELLREIVEVRYPDQRAAFDDYAAAAVRTGTRISNLRELMKHAAQNGVVSPLRPFVVIIDEFVDLLDAGPSTRRDFEGLIARFSRLFRYVGGTMIVATQRPSVKSITGDIKANFRPLALRVERSVDSRVILDENGAEQLIGQGDSLYKTDEGLVRLQGYSALGTYVEIGG